MFIFEQYICKNCNALSSASESCKQNPRDRILDLPVFFRLKHTTSLKIPPSPTTTESLNYWIWGNIAAKFVLSYWLSEFLLSAFANRFELRFEPKQLMPLYYEICPCSLNLRVAS